MSGEIVNLNKARKAKAKAKAGSDAKANRAKFGRSKVERLKQADEVRRADRTLNLHRLDRSGKTPPETD